MDISASGLSLMDLRDPVIQHAQTPLREVTASRRKRPNDLSATLVDPDSIPTRARRAEAGQALAPE
jgi:hypothetical protein